MNEGTGRIRDRKFKSWAIPFGIYTKGQLSHTVTHRDANTSQVLNCLITSLLQGHQILLLPEMKYSTPSNSILCIVCLITRNARSQIQINPLPEYYDSTTMIQREYLCINANLKKKSSISHLAIVGARQNKSCSQKPISRISRRRA
jgi:hypothetical protein